MATTETEARGDAPPIIADPAVVRRIATFHLNGLGDLLFTLPALRALRETFPRAVLCSVVRPAFVPLLRDSPLLDEVVPRPRGPWSKPALIARLRARPIDLAVAFSQSGPATLLARLCGAPVRVGFTGAHFPNLLTHRVPRQGPPCLERHLDLVRALGCRTARHDYGGLVPVGPRSRERADALLAEHGVTEPFVIAACQASEKRGIKEWPPEHWAAALRALAPRWPVVLVGTRPSRVALSHERVVDLGGRTDLPDLAALCGRAGLCIGVDSGVLHLAAAMGVPVIGIFGPTDWRRTGPRGAAPRRVVRLGAVSCAPCHRSRCLWQGPEERRCLTGLSPQAVVRAAHDLLAREESSGCGANLRAEVGESCYEC